MTNTKVQQESELSNADFVFCIHSSHDTLSMLRQKTLARIEKEIKEFLDPDIATYYTPSFGAALRLCTELFAYGFVKTAHAYVTALGKLIRETHPDHFQWWRLCALQFPDYQIPTDLHFLQEKPLFPSVIFMEEVPAIELDWVVYEWCWDSDKDKGHKDAGWKKSVIRVPDLVDFINREEHNCGLQDFFNERGEHDQRAIEIDAHKYLVENLREMVAAFVKAGGETFPYREVEEARS